ncbi:MAG TPA: DHA2 family efflux MFS transporter permease subunit [Acidobacteriota bacterium]|nr:DHA2 family efflux MFS transporter permease subunit [Acidobacteriota bacterium]
MSRSSTADLHDVNPWLVGISVLAGTFMVILDSTVVNVSLPFIAGNLSATVEEATWVLTTYLAANAVIIPITGWLANYFGRRRLLLIAVTGFTAASFFCGFAPDLHTLIAFRILQGISGGVMQPLSQAIMLESFPPHERGQAMALWGLGIVAAPIFGPVLGGWLTDNYSWRWVFYINIPIGIMAFLMIRRFVFDPSYIRRGTSRIDYWGLILMVVGIGALQIGLDQGQEKDWFASDWIAAMFVVAVVALIALIVHEWLARSPVIDLRTFRELTYSTGVALITMTGFVLYGSMVIFPILLQTLLGYPPLQAGIAMAPRGLGMLIMMPLVGVLIRRVDARRLIACGFGIGATTLLWYSTLNLNAGYWDYFWPQLIQGMSFALIFVPLTTTTMDPIPNESMGNATSIFNLMRNVGGSAGIAATQTLLSRGLQRYLNILGAHVTAYDPAMQERLRQLQSAFTARGADPVTAAQQARGALWGTVQRQAAILTFNRTFLLFGAIMAVLVPLGFMMRRPRSGRQTAASE